MKTSLMAGLLVWFCTAIVFAQSIPVSNATATIPKMSDEFVRGAMETVNAIITSTSGTDLAQEHASEILAHAATIKDLEMDSDVRMREQAVIANLEHLQSVTADTELRLKNRASMIKIEASQDYSSHIGAGGDVEARSRNAYVNADAQARLGNPNDAESNKIRTDYKVCTGDIKEQIRQHSSILRVPCK